MITFNDILVEGLADVKAAAVAGIKAGKYKYENTDESRFQFVRDMKAEGFTGSAVSNAWKSAMVTGEFFIPADKGSKPAKAAPKKAVLTDAEVKSLDKAWADVHAAYEKAAALSGKLHAKVASTLDAATASKINVRDTPDLYAVLYGLKTSSQTEDFGKRLAQITHYVGDVGRHYKKL